MTTSPPPQAARAAWVRRLGSSSVGGVVQILHEPQDQLRGSLTGHVVYVLGAQLALLCDAWARELEGSPPASVAPWTVPQVWTVQRSPQAVQRRGVLTAWTRRDSRRLRECVDRLGGAVHDVRAAGPLRDQRWWEAVAEGLDGIRVALGALVRILPHTSTSGRRRGVGSASARLGWAAADAACRDALAVVWERWEALVPTQTSTPGPLPTQLQQVLDCSDPVERLRATVQLPVGESVWAEWALLHSREVSTLFGAPIPARCLATRHLLPAELRAEQGRAASLAVRWEGARAEAARPTWESVSAAWHADELLSTWAMSSQPTVETLVDHHAVRLRHLESLLHDPVCERPRQAVTLSTAGGGRAVEMFGEWSSTMSAVAVLVPGTGTDLRGMHMPAAMARALQERLGPGAVVFAWMDADFPLTFVNHSPWARFAQQSGEALRLFVDGLQVPQGVPVTLIGHSYGGAMVGAAERAGVRVDRVIHAASAGAGPGVRSVRDYAGFDAWGRERRVDRFAVMAGGDPVSYAHVATTGVSAVLSKWRGVGERLWSGLQAVDLGVDPRQLEGVTVFDAGVWVANSAQELRAGVGPSFGYAVVPGAPLRGPAAHNGVLLPFSSCYEQIANIVGGDADRSGGALLSSQSTI